MAVDKKKLLANLDERSKKYMEVMGALDIDTLIDAVVKTDETADAATVQSVLLKEVLMPKIFEQGNKSYKRADGVSAAVQTRKNPDIVNRTKLIAAGVDPDLIDRCTDPGGESDPFVVVRVPKAKVS